MLTSWSPGNHGGDDRASAEAVGTILALGTLLVFAGLAIPALGLVTDAAATGQQNQLEFNAQRLSGEIQTVDQLVRSSDSAGPIGRHVSFPERIGNERYTITVTTDPGGDQSIIFHSNSQSLSARVLFVSETPVQNTTITGGDLHIRRPNGATEIEIRAGENP